MISLLTLFELRADPSSEYLLGYVLLKLLFTMWYIRQKAFNGRNSKVKLCVLLLLYILIYLKGTIHYKHKKVLTEVIDSIKHEDEDPEEDTKESMKHVKNLIEKYENMIETHQVQKQEIKIGYKNLVIIK